MFKFPKYVNTFGKLLERHYAKIDLTIIGQIAVNAVIREWQETALARGRASSSGSLRWLTDWCSLTVVLLAADHHFEANRQVGCWFAYEMCVNIRQTGKLLFTIQEARMVTILLIGVAGCQLSGKCMKTLKKCPLDSAPRSAPVWTFSRMRMPHCGPTRTPPEPVWSMYSIFTHCPNIRVRVYACASPWQSCVYTTYLRLGSEGIWSHGYFGSESATFFHLSQEHAHCKTSDKLSNSNVCVRGNRYI